MCSAIAASICEGDSTTGEKDFGMTHVNSVPHSGLPGSRETKAPATTLLLVVHSFHEGYMQCLQSGRTVSEPGESEQVVSLVRFRTSSNCPRYDAYSARSDRRQRTGGGLRPHPCRYLRDSTQMGYLDKITSAPLSFVRHFVRLLVRPLLSCQQTSEAVNQDIVTIHHSPFTIHHSPFTIHHSPFTIHHS